MIVQFGFTAGNFVVGKGRKGDGTFPAGPLAEFLQNTHANRLRCMSVGEGDCFFWAEMPCGATPPRYGISDSVRKLYPEVHAMFETSEPIRWVAFGCGGAFVMQTETGTYTSEPEILKTEMIDGMERPVPLRLATFGPPNVWVVVDTDGTVRTKGLSDTVVRLLKDRPLKQVAISHTSTTNYFIQYADGTTVYDLPLEMQKTVRKTTHMVVHFDSPPENFGFSIEKNILFAFGPTYQSYCIINGKRAGWNACPKVLDDMIRSGPVNDISSVSMGFDGAIFWKRGSQSYLSFETQHAYPEVWNLYVSGESPINWVAFGPDGMYVVDRDDGLYAWNAETLLRRDVNGGHVALRCASFGYGGSWVVVEADGDVRSCGLKSQVRKALLQGNIKNVQLSLTDPTDYYIEFMNNKSLWHCPEAWNDTVEKVERHLPMPDIRRDNALERLEENSSQYASISYLFNVSWRHTDKPRPTIKYIYKVRTRLVLLERYNAYLAKVGNEQNVFHGTYRHCRGGEDGQPITLCYHADCRLCSILRTSYHVASAKATGMFGSGIYTSSVSSKSAQYSHNVTTGATMKALILNKVAVGNAYFTTKSDRSLAKPPKGYDSVCGLTGGALKFDEMIVYNGDAIRPQYLILYQ